MLTPQWQADGSAANCTLCQQLFTFMFRRHHCRCCGRVVCHDCLCHWMSYPSSVLVATLTGPMSSQEWDRYRTCDRCKLELDRVGNTLMAPALVALSIPTRVEDSENLCPVCGKNLRVLCDQTGPLDLDDFKELHIRDCLAGYDFSKSPERTSQILVYNIPPIPLPQYHLIDEQVASTPTEKTLDSECVICLEELEPGDKVGRLECLCVFHYKCIKDWFNKRGYGQCPVHIH